MATEQTTCKNCEQEFEKGFEFCPHCGQKANDELTIGVLFYNTISNYFSFDARFFKSFIPLMIRPGYLAKKFLEGKRLLYLHPAQMYLFISVIFFFLFSFVAREQEESIDRALKRDYEKAKKVIDTISEKGLDSAQVAKLMKPYEANKDKMGLNEVELKELDSLIKTGGNTKPNMNFGFDENKIDSLIDVGAADKVIYKEMGMDDDAGYFKKRFYAQMLKFYKTKSGGSILKAFYDTIPIAMFFLLPIFAFILKLFYFRKGAYAYHLVFSFYFFSFLFTVFSVLLLLNFAWADFPGWITFLIMISTFIYLFIALKRFYDQGWFLSFLKSSMVTFTFFVFLFPASLAVLFVAFLSY
ncbi:hypothetical protein C1T31_09210 [Hanstruepera neustonica]|uniref:DUF3667 domain-containing protein n=1 Tax=Hanstruepera neustonica TaxID=1445657 RepID=A0A2K1DYQ5_9FLAO|nr:DUF3667 domain-containing protein [Hanstruepera neustonica]PNQ73150.1 hypothetical protein C1T31_09210 [Hanstruepera neustonica]